MDVDDDGADGGSLWAADRPRAVLRRVWIAIGAIGAFATIGAFALGGTADAVGVLIGTILAAVNFGFLQSSMTSLLGAGHERAPSGTTLMFVMRWALVAMLGYAAYRSGAASGAGLIAGLLAPAGAVVLEAGFQVFAAFRRGD